MTTAQMAERRLIVTGARGFLASVVATRARAQGWEVTLASRHEQSAIHDASLSVDQLAAHLEKAQPTAIFHGAGSANVRASFEQPTQDLAASVGTVSKWLEAARLWGGKPHFIFPSSAAVYGSPSQLPVHENAACAAISPYGMHKHMGEMLARQYHEMHQLPATVLRLFSVYGPSQRRLLVWELFQRLCSESTLEIQGTGAESRDYLYEEDAAAAILAIAERPPEQSTLPVFNLASGHETSVIQVATTLRDAIAPAKEIRCKGIHRLGDPPRWWADVSSIRSLLPSWSPRPLTVGIEQTLNHWQRTIA